jgi:hypothetical protein
MCHVELTIYRVERSGLIVTIRNVFKLHSNVTLQSLLKSKMHYSGESSFTHNVVVETFVFWDVTLLHRVIFSRLFDRT